MPARNAEQEAEILQWIEAVLGEPLPKGDYEEVKNIMIAHPLVSLVDFKDRYGLFIIYYHGFRS